MGKLWYKDTSVKTGIFRNNMARQELNVDNFEAKNSWASLELEIYANKENVHFIGIWFMVLTYISV